MSDKLNLPRSIVVSAMHQGQQCGIRLVQSSIGPLSFDHQGYVQCVLMCCSMPAGHVWFMCIVILLNVRSIRIGVLEVVCEKVTNINL